MVLGFELRTYTLSHSTSLFCELYFEIGSCELFASSNLGPPDLCLLSTRITGVATGAWLGEDTWTSIPALAGSHGQAPSKAPVSNGNKARALHDTHLRFTVPEVRRPAWVSLGETQGVSAVFFWKL
jgi:hypothetical protein